MIKEEAYNKMNEGYMVTHKLFRPTEYLYMDDLFIIRDQDGDTFETDWDVRTSPEWNMDWYIFKGKHNKGVPAIKKKDKVNMTALPMMDTGREIYNEMQAYLTDKAEDQNIIDMDDNTNQSYVEYNKADAEYTRLLYEDMQPKSWMKKLLLKILYFFIRRLN